MLHGGVASKKTEEVRPSKHEPTRLPGVELGSSENGFAYTPGVHFTAWLSKPLTYNVPLKIVFNPHSKVCFFFEQFTQSVYVVPIRRYVIV